MADKILQNLHLETLPNHSNPHYNALRALLITTGISEAEAVLSLNQTWTSAHDNRIAAWDQQVRDDVLAQEEAVCAAEELEKEIQTQKEKESESEQQEMEKKKPKMNNFDTEQAIDNFILPRLAAFALDDFNFVELWHFSQEGCLDASTNHHAQHKDTFGLTKASRNVIPDINLSWQQMTIARTTLVQHLSSRWPAKHKSLLIYQAQAWHNWHDQLKQNRAFNITIINENLLQTIYREVLDGEQKNLIKEVSYPFPSSRA
ncbi:hypothetical protein BYT27DRAFT_7224418 [Phlegmacium glaucopus]|nr:hypothetical protein BYT27DRAFT_7224418 [Phlegmacium glaucopus]